VGYHRWNRSFPKLNRKLYQWGRQRGISRLNKNTGHATAVNNVWSFAFAKLQAKMQRILAIGGTTYSVFLITSGKKSPLIIYKNYDRILIYNILEGCMPTIRPSADLRNKYNEISELCHKYSEPVFITKNGTGDLAVMSIKMYEFLAGKTELYKLIDEGLAQVKEGRIKPMKGTIKSIREKIK
jgi:prevent-host-death family protein